ncbi:MAG: M23 family metallopeptidase [Ekhidna sp.]
MIQKILFIIYSAAAFLINAQTPLKIEYETLTIEEESRLNFLPYEDGAFTMPMHAKVLEIPGYRSVESSFRGGDFINTNFGARIKSSGRNDNHGGVDINSTQVVVQDDGSLVHHGRGGDDGSLPNLYCMCDGTVEFVDNDTGASNGLKKVLIKCDRTFQGQGEGWGNIYIEYLHISSTPWANEGDEDDIEETISEGDLVAVMGSTGAGSYVHLHLDVAYCPEDKDCSAGSNLIEVHPMRLFSPEMAPHVITHLQQGGVFVERLDFSTTAGTALFRVSTLPNQTGILAFKANYNGSQHATHDFEETVNLDEGVGAGERDNPCAVDNICVWSNPYNLYKSAYLRFIEDFEEDMYDDGNYHDHAKFPIFDYSMEDDFPYNLPVRSFDVEVSGLLSGFDINLLELEIHDVYGHVAKVNAGGAIIESISNGNWSSGSNWSGGSVPEASDHVIINHEIELTGSVNAESLTVSSGLNTDATLAINGSGNSLNVDYLTLIGENDGQSSIVTVSNGGTISVAKDLTIKRFKEPTLVSLDVQGNESVLNVTEDLIFEGDIYTGIEGGGSSESFINIGTSMGGGNAAVTIGGDLILNRGAMASSAMGLKMGIPSGSNAPSLNIGGNLEMTSNRRISNSSLLLEMYANSTLSIENKLVLNFDPSIASDNHDVRVELHDYAEMTVTDETKLYSRLAPATHTSGTGDNEIRIFDKSKATLEGEVSIEIQDASLAKNIISVQDESCLEFKNSIASSGGNISNTSFYAGDDPDDQTIVKFTGNAPQIIPALTNPSPDVTSDYDVLEINNTSGEEISLMSSIAVKNKLQITDGVLVNNAITIGPSGTIDISEENYIGSSVAKDISLSHDPFVLPIGADGVRAAITIDPSTTGNYPVQASYIRGVPASEKEEPIVNLGFGYWVLLNFNSASLQANFHWESACEENIEDLTEGIGQTLFMTKLSNPPNPTWQQIAETEIVDGSEACNEEDMDTEQGSLRLTMPASEYGGSYSFGTTDINANPLPVTLTYLNASKTKRGVLISWETLNELNSYSFIIQRSTNGLDYQLVAEIPAAGRSSSPISYLHLDKEPKIGVSFYRLMQIDVNGVSEIYGPRRVEFDRKADFTKVFPTVIFANDPLRITLQESPKENIHINILNINGQLVYERSFLIEEDASFHEIEVRPSLNEKGIYIVQIRFNHQEISKKIIVK